MALIHRAFATAAVTLSLLVPLRSEAGLNLSGTWALNPAASDLGGMKPPRSDVITIDHQGEDFAWSEVIVMADGSVEKEAWRGKMDGVARAVDGVPGSKASYLPDGSGRWTSPEADSDLLGALSADGQQFIVTSTTRWRDGRTTVQRFVYDRTK